MSQSRKLFKASAIPETALRRLRVTPSYFFLIWRWSMWLYALIVIVFFTPKYVASPTILPYSKIATLLLTITFLQTLVVTLYAPIFQMLLPQFRRASRASTSGKPKRRQRVIQSEDEEPGGLPPLSYARSKYWDVAIYAFDVIICGLVMYYSGPFTVPPFGVGSPFYRYGMSTVFAASLAYRYRGGLIAAAGYDSFAVLGMLKPAPGEQSNYPSPNVIDIVGSLIDTPLAALLTAYIATLIDNYARSKKHEQNNARIQRSLVRVGETLIKSAHDRQGLLQRSVGQILQGGHFDYLSIVLIAQPNDDEENPSIQSEILTRVEATAPQVELPEPQTKYFEQALQSGQEVIIFEPVIREDMTTCGDARIYLPLPKGELPQIILGAESRRGTPFDQSKEEFLTIAGTQLLIALDNIRLTEQMVQMAATAERGRIAREIHDGIAQLIYMLSLNAETCETQARRIVEASEEDAELITPLADRLGKLVTVSKQALWETRNYMFSLKPLMSGTTTLTQMLTNQLREFETISDLPVQLEIEGTEVMPSGDRLRSRRYAQIGAALFRIVQEALTNAYKHAGATQLQVHLHFKAKSIEVEIMDNGHGMSAIATGVQQKADTDNQRIYSGHGLSGMNERATELGGTFAICPNPTGGTKIQACIPV